MKYMLDTNTCIFLLEHIPEVLSSFAAKKDDGVAISSITLAELEFGVCNSVAYETNRSALIAFLPIVEVLPFDGAAAEEYGVMCTVLRRKGKAIGTMDMLIAAHAKAVELILVTNNIREFARIEGLNLEDWFN